MKAIQFVKYGSLIDFKMIEKEIPKPGKNQVVIKVVNSSMNAMDWHIFRGITMVKLKVGFFKPRKKYNVLGADVSGKIVQVGEGVSKYEIGDEVFGDIFTGGFAEYAVAHIDVITKKPSLVSHEQAAGVPVAGMTALEAVKNVANVQADDHVLVNGASGGVGSFCVQLAKSYGAKVTAVCSGKNVDFVKSLGADEVINYEERDFTQEEFKYDKVLEVIGNKTPTSIKAILKPNGLCAVIGFTSAGKIMRYMLAFSKQIKMVTVKSTPVVMNELAELLEQGKMKSFITERLPLSEVPRGMKKMKSRRSVGKTIILNEE